jgi:hypothetical protein
MAQTVEELEELINQVALKIGKDKYGLREGMFRIYLDPDLTVDFRAERGPTVQLYISKTPFGKDRHAFADALHAALSRVEKLWSPVALVHNSYYTDIKNGIKRLAADAPYTPSFQLSEKAVRYKTTTRTTVEVTHKGTGITVRVASDKLTEWALKKAALNELSRKVERYYNEPDDDESGSENDGNTG